MIRMTQFERYLAPLGRILIGLFFIMAGLGSLADMSNMANYIESVGLPYGYTLNLISVAIQIVAGFMVLTGYKGKVGASILTLFVIIVTPLFHGPHMWENNPYEQVMFMKNIALIGALLFVAAHVGRASVNPEASVSPKPTL